MCASAVISPLKQWLDSYAKTRLKMCHTFKHFIHMRYFLLLTNLVIVFVHWVNTGVCCTNPDNVHCFGTIFPNLNFVFVSICAARAVHIQSDQYRSCSTVKQRRAVGATLFTPMGSNQKQHCGSDSVREMTWYLYTRGVRGRMKAKQRWFKVTRELCHEWFYHVRHRVHDGHWTGEFATVSYLTSTLFHSLVPWWHPRRIRSQRTRNGHVANLQELL